MDEILETETRGRVVIVRLNRPERLNALTQDLVREISETLERVADDEACQAIVLTGAGRGFCAGLDLVARQQLDADRRRPTSVRFASQQRFARMIRTIRGLRVPVIAAVNGPAAGAGMGLTLAADIRVVDESAAFHPAALKIGLSAGECGLSYMLPRLIGSARAFEILLTARPVAAQEAVRIGLALEADTGSTAVDTAVRIAESIAEHDPFAVKLSREVLWSNLDATFDVAIELENRTQILAGTSDAPAQARAAFIRDRGGASDS